MRGLGRADRVRMHAAAVYDDEFAGFDVANELGVDDVEGAAFLSDDMRAFELSQAKRPEPVGVPGGNHVLRV